MGCDFIEVNFVSQFRVYYTMSNLVFETVFFNSEKNELNVFGARSLYEGIEKHMTSIFETS